MGYEDFIWAKMMLKKFNKINLYNSPEMFIFTQNHIFLTVLNSNIEQIAKLLSTDVRKFTKNIISKEITEKITSSGIKSLNDLIRQDLPTDIPNIALSKIDKQLYFLSYNKLKKFSNRELDFLPIGPRNVLYSNNIFTIKKLINCSEQDLCRLRCMGKINIQKIKTELQKRNLSLNNVNIYSNEKEVKAFSKHKRTVLIGKLKDIKEYLLRHPVIKEDYRIKYIIKLCNESYSLTTLVDFSKLKEIISFFDKTPRYSLTHEEIEKYKSIRYELIQVVEDLIYIVVNADKTLLKITVKKV